MKVAIIQELIDTSRGGAETSTLEMARRLAELSLDVTVVCADLIDPTVESKLKFKQCDSAGGSRAARTKSFIAAADRFCRQEQFDIVHAVMPCYSCNVYQPRGGTYVETVERSIARVDSGLGASDQANRTSTQSSAALPVAGRARAAVGGGSAVCGRSFRVCLPANRGGFSTLPARAKSSGL